MDQIRQALLEGRCKLPKGTGALICEAVVTGHHTLTRAMGHGHPMLFRLLGMDVPTGYFGVGYEECRKIATKPITPKAATMTTLAAVLAAWEDSIGKHTWRNPTAWDARLLGALMEWGYPPSEVECLLLGKSDEGTETSDADTVHNETEAEHQADDNEASTNSAPEHAA